MLNGHPCPFVELRQGDKERGRQGENASTCPLLRSYDLSPCLLISLSPCLLVFLPPPPSIMPLERKRPGEPSHDPQQHRGQHGRVAGRDEQRQDVDPQGRDGG